MPQLGRSRDPKIRREERHCDVHGLTTFAFYTAGAGKSHSNTASVSWHCMACNCDKDAAYRARIASGAQVVKPRTLRLEPTAGALCSSCFVELGSGESGPLCGECA